jgi:hypothetical protein
MGLPQIYRTLGIQPELTRDRREDRKLELAPTVQYGSHGQTKSAHPWRRSEDDHGSSMAPLNWIFWFSPGILDYKREKFIWVVDFKALAF